ncbi:unnamed protein product [Symbiodinium sp. CCMP2592]|nr:unnamed protein product [Symbiodinium sp. CCMP2592]
MLSESVSTTHVAAALILLSFHWSMTHVDVLKFVGKLGQYARQNSGGSAHAGNGDARRISAAMEQLRENSYVETSKLMVHVNGMSMVIIPFIYDRGNAVFMVGILLAAAAAYATHLAIACDKIRLRAQQLKVFVAAYYAITVVCILCGSGFEHMRLMETGQITLFACYCDSTVHVPGQAALALAEIVCIAASSGLQSVSVELVAAPLLKALILIFSSVVLESTMKEGVAAQFRGADAESMVTSFRTMLKGLSDAELLLDESLQITDDDDLLRGALVMESLKGQVFSNLLLPDTEEQDRFQKFIHRQKAHPLSLREERLHVCEFPYGQAVLSV